MRWAPTLVAAAMALAASTPSLLAQAGAKPPSAAQIKQELEKIKKSRTLALFPAEGMEEPGDPTQITVENTSSFTLVVLIVGPTTSRVEIGPFRSETRAVEPGDYELAVTAVGRGLPPFYGKQKITAKLSFHHKISIPAV